MLRFRPFKQVDAKTILSWIQDEKMFWQWSAGRYPGYPPKAEDMLQVYGATENTDNFYPMTAFDETGIVGHMIMRYIDDTTIRFGFIIVDGSKRGKGYGKQMLQLAIKYAREFLGAEKITIGVFENNLPARHCYESLGFREEEDKAEYYELMSEKWKCLELVLD